MGKENREGRPSGQQKSALTRNRWAKVMVVFGVILFAFAVAAVWLNRTVTNTDSWVATMAPLASQPAIQSYVADTASDAILSNADVEAFVSQALPPRAQPLTAPITNAVENFTRQAALKFTQSKQFLTLWTAINRAGHRAIIAVVNGDRGALSSSNGQITLNIGTIVVNLKERLAAAGLNFVNKIPTKSLENKTIVLFQSTSLEQISTALQIMNRTAILLSTLTLVLLAGAIALAIDRRLIILWIGVGAILATLLPLGALYLAQPTFIQSLVNLNVPSSVAQAIYSTVFRGLYALLAWYIAVGFGVWVVAAIAGPSTWAVSLRRDVQGRVQGIRPDRDFGTFGEWVAAHKQALRIAGYIIAAIAFVLPAAVNIGYFLVLSVALLAWLGLIEFFGRPKPEQVVGVAGAGRGQPAA